MVGVKNSTCIRCACVCVEGGGVSRCTVGLSAAHASFYVQKNMCAHKSNSPNQLLSTTSNQQEQELELQVHRRCLHVSCHLITTLHSIAISYRHKHWRHGSCINSSLGIELQFPPSAINVSLFFCKGPAPRQRTSVSRCQCGSGGTLALISTTVCLRADACEDADQEVS